MIINSVSYSLSNIQSAASPKGDTVKLLTTIDGTDIVINFGARLRKSCSFTMINITQANFLLLTEYLILNAGKKVALRPENAGETLFADLPYGDITDYYCYVLIPKNLQVEDFSVTNNLYTLNLTVELAGVDNSAVLPNEDGTSTIDLLLQIDTVQADHSQSAISTPTYAGQRWLDTDDNVLREVTNIITLATATWTAAFNVITQAGAFVNYKFVAGDYIYIVSGTGVTSTGFHKVASKFDDNSILLETSIAAGDLATGDIVSKGFWKILYTVTADNATYGFKDGIFYLAAFSTTTYDSNDYKAGLINLGSIKLPGKNIDINRGPSIEKREGFSFAINDNYNGTKFWKWLITNSIGLFGNKAIAGVWESGPTFTGIATGKTIAAKFNYTSYEHKVEPFSLNKNDKFPSIVIDTSNTRYKDVEGQFLGKPPYVTYGEHKYAALQNISSKKIILEPIIKIAGDPILGDVTTSVITCEIDSGDDFKLDVWTDKTATSLPAYTFTTDEITDMNSTLYAIEVTNDNRGDNDNVGVTKRIDSITDTGSKLILSLDSVLPVGYAIGVTLNIRIYKFMYQYQIDEKACDGFGVTDESNNYTADEMELFVLNESKDDLLQIPQTEFILNTDGNKNIIFLNPKMSLNATNITTYKTVLQNGSLFTMIKNGTQAVTAYDPGLDFPTDYTEWSRTFDQGILATKYAWSAGFVDTTIHSAEFTSGQPPAVVNGVTPRTIDATFRFGSNAGVVAHMQENAVVLGFEIPVTHNSSQADYIASADIKLLIDMDVISRTLTRSGATPNAKLDRRISAGFKLRIRFRKYDDSYIQDNSGDPHWTHEFTESQLGVYDGGTGELGSMTINNRPDNEGGSGGGFVDGTSTLTDNYDYLIVQKVVNVADLVLSTSTITYNKGDKAYVYNDGVSAANNGLYTWDGSAWNQASGGGVDPGDIIYWREAGSRTLFESDEIYKVDNANDTWTAAVEGTDYKALPKFQGRDMFDLSVNPAIGDELFGSGGEWQLIEAMEVQIINLDLANQYNGLTKETIGSTDFPYFRNWEIKVSMDRVRFWLYEATELEIVNQPIFSAVRGRKLPLVGGSFSKAPEAIVTDIMNDAGMYLNKWDTTSITTLMALATRSGWNWRRQFTTALSSEETLQELLDNLWACAVIDKDDKIVFKSMNPEDYSLGSPSRTFNDANILVDSVSPPKFRRMNEVFTEFHLNYDYNIPSEFSEVFKKYNESTLIDGDNGSTQTKRYINVSKDINNIENSYEKGFKYHYESLPLAEWVGQWFALNVWRFKFRVAISQVLGSNALAIMDFVKVNSSFYTDSADVEGFVTSIKINLYNATAEIGVHVYRPPGVFGPLCDNFKDARTTDRDISGWTAAGKINDAGTTARSIGDYTKDDAGTTPRDLSC